MEIDKFNQALPAHVAKFARERREVLGNIASLSDELKGGI